MPTFVTRYVNTGSTAGGDGTTNATSGANRAWATLEEARAGIIGTWASLVASDVQVDLIMSGTTDDTTAVTNTWPTSDAPSADPATWRCIHFQVPTADQKVPWDTNVYSYGRAVNFAAALTISTNTFRMTGLQLYHAGNLNVGGNHGLVIGSLGGYALLEGVKVAKANNAGQMAIAGNALTGTIILRNCITGISAFGASSFGWLGGFNITNMPSNTTVLVYNLTTRDNTNGGSAFSITLTFTGGATNAVVRIKNVLAQTCTNDITVTNATTDDRATNVYSNTTTASFVDAANGDLRLTVADAVAKDLGTDLSGVADFPFSNDADLNTRPFGPAWDIGAHENQNARGRTYAMIFD